MQTCTCPLNTENRTGGQGVDPICPVHGKPVQSVAVCHDPQITTIEEQREYDAMLVKKVIPVIMARCAEEFGKQFTIAMTGKDAQDWIKNWRPDENKGRSE